jgi:hypothetical protein
MLRLLTTLLACIFLVSFLAIGFSAGPVQADQTFLLSATSKDAEYVGNFSLRYVDVDNDRSFSHEELVTGSFSGFTWGVKAGGGMNGITLTRLLQVPAVPNFPYTDQHRWPIYPPEYPFWLFQERVAEFVYVVMIDDENYGGPWTYGQTAVPIPPSVFLLGAGLLGLAAARRKKRLGQ